MLRKLWAGRDGIVWSSRRGPGPRWALQTGAAALDPLMADAGTVICLAGATPGSGDFAANAEIAEAVVASAARRTRPPHVFLASSMAVYGSRRGPCSEASPTAPIGNYGRSKLEMERRAAALAAGAGVGVTALRLGNVVGVDMLFRNIAGGAAVVLDRFPDGRTPVRSYIDPERLGQALDRLAALAAAGEALPGVLNLAGEPPLEMADLVRAAGLDVSTRPAPAGALPEAVMDTGRAKALVPALEAPRDAAAAVAAWRRVEALS